MGFFTNIYSFLQHILLSGKYYSLVTTLFVTAGILIVEHFIAYHLPFYLDLSLQVFSLDGR